MTSSDGGKSNGGKPDGGKPDGGKPDGGKPDELASSTPSGNPAVHKDAYAKSLSKSSSYTSGSGAEKEVAFVAASVAPPDPYAHVKSYR